MMFLFLINSFLIHKTLIDGVDCCDVYISCLDSHSDGTHSLQSIHWWVCYVMLYFFKPVLINKLIYILDGLRVNTSSANLVFFDETTHYSYSYLDALQI